VADDKYEAGIEPVPDARVLDHARRMIEAVVSEFPLGGTLMAFFDTVVAPAQEKRRTAWLRELAEAVDELRNRGVDFDALAEDEAFVSAVFTASRIAMGTHLEQKLEQLKNCLLHMALDAGRDDFLDLRLFTYVDELHPEHFIVLDYLNDPIAWFERNGIERPNIYGGPGMEALRKAQLPISGMPLDLVLRDLSDNGLADTGGLGVMVTENAVFASHTTELGRELLAFVREV